MRQWATVSHLVKRNRLVRRLLFGAIPFLGVSIRMNRYTRRQLVQGALGLGILGAGGLVLLPEARATPASGTLGSYAAYLLNQEKGLLLAEDRRLEKPAERQLVAT